MRAVILAAGFGTRLWPLTEDRTKPAIPFLNRPLITFSVEYLAAHGIRDLIVNLHHQPDSIRNALGDGSRLGVSIHYSYEEEILGTSGALDRVRELLLDDDFVVINGKIVTDIDLTAAIDKHRESRALATLVLRENAYRQHFSMVEVDGRGHISRFAGFPEASNDDSKTHVAPLMFTGIQVLSPAIFEYIPRSRYSHSVTDVYPRAMEAGETVIAHIAPGLWHELSTLSRYLEVSLLFCQKQGLSLVSGEGCVIEDDALIERSVLWRQVTVERGARVRECIVADGVRIPAGAVFERVAIVRRDIVHEVERGEIAGENIIVPL